MKEYYTLTEENILRNVQLLVSRRADVGTATVQHLDAAARLKEAEAELSAAQLAAQSEPDAGRNEAARKSYALEATRELAITVDALRSVVLEKEIELVGAKTRLAVAEIIRRGHEMLIKLPDTSEEEE